MAKSGKQSGGTSSKGVTKNLSPEQHAANKRAAQGRRRKARVSSNGRLGISSGETLVAGIQADREERRQEERYQNALEMATNDVRRFGSTIPTDQTESRWAPETIELATALMKRYFSEDEEPLDVRLAQEIVSDVRWIFTKTCVRYKLQDKPGQNGSWYPELAAKAQRWLDNKRAKVPANA